MTRAGESHDPTGSRSGWRSRVAAATRATLERPDAWPVALAGLLVRGALVPFALPIVVLPTMTGLATALGPLVISIALGQPNVDVARLVALVVVGVLVWILVSILLGALTDAVLVRWLTAELEDQGQRLPVRLAEVLRVAAVRATAHLPLLLAAGWGATRLVTVARAELITPGDLAVPLVLRVAAGLPDVALLLAATWGVGEAVGELAARSVMLEGTSAVVGLGRAIGGSVRHLPAVAATLLLGTAGLFALVVPAIVAASVAWGGLRGALLGEGPAVVAVIGALALSACWLGGLALAALAATWRSALWTAEALRQRTDRRTGASG